MSVDLVVCGSDIQENGGKELFLHKRLINVKYKSSTTIECTSLKAKAINAVRKYIIVFKVVGESFVDDW